MPADKWASNALYNYIGIRTPEFVNACVGSRSGQLNVRVEAVLNAVLLDVKSMFADELKKMSLPLVGLGGTESERDTILKAVNSTSIALV